MQEVQQLLGTREGPPHGPHCPQIERDLSLAHQCHRLSTRPAPHQRRYTGLTKPGQPLRNRCDHKGLPHPRLPPILGFQRRDRTQSGNLQDKQAAMNDVTSSTRVPKSAHAYTGCNNTNRHQSSASTRLIDLIACCENPNVAVTAENLSRL